jgi:hypothetical protein
VKWAIAGYVTIIAVLASWLAWLVAQVPGYRRFNRTRYNAEAVVTAFTARLRQTVDLDTVQGDLVGVVHQAFAPAHVSVWVAAVGQREALSPRALPRHVSS